MFRTPADRSARIMLFAVALLALSARLSPAAESPHRNPLRVPANPAADAANNRAQLASYVTEPLATEYVVDNGCDPALACDAPVEYVPGMQVGPQGCLALWGGIEYLLWWQKDASLPPLVTTSPSGTSRDVAGVLGAPNTTTLFGDEPYGGDTVSGGRLTFGAWIDGGYSTGLGGRLFALDENFVRFRADTAEFPILARPFFNVFTDEADALLLGFPGDLQGDVQVELKTETTGAQAFIRQLMRAGCNYRLDFVYGYRYLQVREWLSIDNSLEFTGTQSPNFGTEVQQHDMFDADNDYHAGELGLMGQSVDGPWTLDFVATVALGEMNERVKISGETVTTPQTGDPVNLVGGLLTQSSNIGTYEQSPFTVMPEATVTLGYFLTPSLNLTVGYSFLYVNNLARPGRMVDTSVNLTQQTGDLEGPARPTFAFKESDFWLQGINFGLNWAF